MGRRTCEAIWGHCVGCPTGPDVTARDVVEYIARGQIKTLACYDVAPGLSIGQIYKTADWYEKTLKFQRAVAKGDGKLEDKVNAFLKELAEPYNPVLSAAMIDTDVAASGSTRMSPNASIGPRWRPQRKSADFAAAGSTLAPRRGRSHRKPSCDRFAIEDYDDARSDACADSDVC